MPSFILVNFMTPMQSGTVSIVMYLNSRISNHNLTIKFVLPHYFIPVKLSDDGVACYPFFLSLGDMSEPVPIHCDNRPHFSFVWSYLIKLFIQLELEVHRSELDQPVEQGGGPADVPLLGLLFISYLTVETLQYIDC